MPAPEGNQYAKNNPGGGRPSVYKDTYPKLAFKIALLGATDVDLANVFDVTEQTINAWKKDHEEFFLALKKGKLEADAKVSKSLFKRANGFRFNEVTLERFENTIVDDFGNISKEPGTKIKTVKKLVIPDTTAQIFWLKNRQPDKWRDQKDVKHSNDPENPLIDYSKLSTNALKEIIDASNTSKGQD